MMCKLCERDKQRESYMNNLPDRMIVLERDHQAMERLRNKKIGLHLTDTKDKKLKWEAIGYWNEPEITNDPAEAILAVE